MKRILLTILGISLIVVGIFGLFLPLLQGILMILLGVFILKSRELTYAEIKQKFKESLKRKDKHKKDIKKNDIKKKDIKKKDIKKKDIKKKD